MKRILILLAATAAVIFTSCNMMAGSGIIVENEFLTGDFTAVEASSTCELNVTEGEEFSVSVTCDDNLVPFLLVEEAGGVLKIGLQPYTSYNRITFEATVVMPDLKEIRASGASSVKASGFAAAPDLLVDVQEASYGEINLDSASDITVNLEGASRLDISSVQPAGNLEIVCSGASQLDMDDCPAVNAAVEVSGASKLWVNLSGTLTGSVSGASNIYCSGTPESGGLSVDFTSALVKD